MELKMFYARFTITMFVSISSFRTLMAVSKVSDCSSKILREKESDCLRKFNLTEHINSGIPIPIFEDATNHLCRHVPGVVSCLQTAFEPCKKPYFDHRTYNRSLVKICSNKQLYMKSELNCHETITVISTCLSKYKSNAKRFQGTESTVKTTCSLLSDLSDCLYINASRSCRKENSEFLTSLYKGRFSSDLCDSKAFSSPESSTSSDGVKRNIHMNQPKTNSASDFQASLLYVQIYHRFYSMTITCILQLFIWTVS